MLTSPSSAAILLPARFRHDSKLELITERSVGPDPSLLDRVDGVLHSILSMPLEAAASDKQLVALAFQAKFHSLFPEPSASLRPSPSHSS